MVSGSGWHFAQHIEPQRADDRFASPTGSPEDSERGSTLHLRSDPGPRRDPTFREVRWSSADVSRHTHVTRPRVASRHSERSGTATTARWVHMIFA